MTDKNEDWFDADIAEMDLGYGEKAGLQIYRNYTKSFEQHAIERFIETIDLETIDLSDFSRIVDLIIAEEARFLPIISCAFADEILKSTFKAALPEGVPGGKAKLFSGYGPLSDFAKRIQMAHVFAVLSPDLMTELDRLRSVRNTISHSWNVADLGEFLIGGRLADMFRVEELLPEHDEIASEFSGGFEPLAAFRIRLVWILGRLVYEAAAYNRAKQARLIPSHALYGKPTAKWLIEVSAISLRATRTIAKPAKSPP